MEKAGAEAEREAGAAGRAEAEEKVGVEAKRGAGAVGWADADKREVGGAADAPGSSAVEGACGAATEESSGAAS